MVKNNWRSARGNEDGNTITENNGIRVVNFKAISVDERDGKRTKGRSIPKRRQGLIKMGGLHDSISSFELVNQQISDHKKEYACTPISQPLRKRWESNRVSTRCRDASKTHSLPGEARFATLGNRGFLLRQPTCPAATCDQWKEVGVCHACVSVRS